jgi:putative oxidoreductase
MFRNLMATQPRVSLLLLRLLLGVVMFPHGAQKVLGWWGGSGLNATIQGFTTHMGIPLVFAWLAVAAEFLGSLGLIVGFLTRVAAFGIAVNMVVAAVMVHLKNGFFMNWMGKQAGEGYEYHLLALAAGLVLMIEGGGKASLDRALTAGRDDTMVAPARVATL